MSVQGGAEPHSNSDRMHERRLQFCGWTAERSYFRLHRTAGVATLLVLEIASGAKEETGKTTGSSYNGTEKVMCCTEVVAATAQANTRKFVLPKPEPADLPGSVSLGYKSKRKRRLGD